MPGNGLCFTELSEVSGTGMDVCTGVGNIDTGTGHFGKFGKTQPRAGHIGKIGTTSTRYHHIVTSK